MNDEQSDFSIIGVSSPYAWDVIESAQRLMLAVTCIDNFGGASPDLPLLHAMDSATDRGQRFNIGLSSAPHRGRALVACAELGFSTPHSLVDPTAILAKTTKVGHAAYINAGVVVGSNTTIGCATNINRSASIGHDNILGFSVSIGPGAVLAGEIALGNFVSVGAGATILPGISVGHGAVIGAGAVVTKNVESFAVVVGNPAKLMPVQPTREASASPSNSLACPYCEAL